jgi:hypothetical protein
MANMANIWLNHLFVISNFSIISKPFPCVKNTTIHNGMPIQRTRNRTQGRIGHSFHLRSYGRLGDLLFRGKEEFFLLKICIGT